jgi:hypothetical protein
VGPDPTSEGQLQHPTAQSISSLGVSRYLALNISKAGSPSTSQLCDDKTLTQLHEAESRPRLDTYLFLTTHYLTSPQAENTLLPKQF